MERIQKVIARSGYTSRRKAELLIVEGKVKVNGKVMNELGYKVKRHDLIEVNGKTLESENKVYFVLYKPKGYISAVSDDKDRNCVTDLLIDVKERIYPIGRLDYQSTGLLLMTNDGEFANDIMHPSSHLEKVYDITIDGLIQGEQLNQLEKGIFLEGVKTLPCKIKVTYKDLKQQNTRMKVRLMEGKNRQVRKMFESLGFKVKRLHRERIGCITLSGMSPGEYRIMKPQEVKELRMMVNKDR